MRGKNLSLLKDYNSFQKNLERFAKTNNNYKTMKAKEQLAILQKYLPVETELQITKLQFSSTSKSLFKQLAIMQERVGKVTTAVLDYHYNTGNLQELKNELIKTSALVMFMLESINKKIKKEEIRNE